MGNDPINNADPSGGFSVPGALIGSGTGFVLGMGYGFFHNHDGGSMLKDGLIGAAIGAAAGGFSGDLFVGAGGAGNASMSNVLNAVNSKAANIASIAVHAANGAAQMTGNFGADNAYREQSSSNSIFHYASYNNAPDWNSKYIFKVHQQANLRAIRLVGKGDNNLLQQKLNAMNDATEWADADIHQTGDFSFMHAMRNEEITQSVQQAKDLSNLFVRRMFALAKDALNSGNIYIAYFRFGIGLHTLQDATSPAHAGFKPWRTNPGKVREWNHIKQELNYPGVLSNLQQITNKYLEWFESDTPLPENNLFDNIKHD